MSKIKSAIAIAVGTLFAGAAFAQSNYSIEQRDRVEDARIDRGIQSGQLTSREASRLEGERAQVERLERRARADGVVTQQERNRITAAQDRVSRDINRESHDRQVSNNNWRTSERPHGWDRRDGNEGRRDLRDVRSDRFGNRDGGRVDHNDSRVNGFGPRTGSDNRSWASTHTGTDTRSGTDTHTGSNTRTGTDTRVAQADTSSGRQSRWQQNPAAQTPVAQTPAQHTQSQTAQVRPAQTQANRPVMVARQGGYSGRHTR